MGSEDGYVYALTSAGILQWRYQTGDGVSSSPAIGSDGTIYVGSNDGSVYALTSAGTLQWRYQTGSSVGFSSPAIGSDGTIYVGSDAIEARTNTAPVLSAGTVQPGSGNEQTIFVFSVTYTDIDNDEPSTISIQLDSGVPVAMNKRQGTGDYKDGVVYEYRTKLTAGTHSYLFAASDGVASAGGSGAASATITVVGTSPPLASFTASPQAGTAPLTVQFTNTTTGTVDGYAWDFGDGGTSNSRDPSHTFTAAGTYTIRLTATNAGGSNSTTRTIVVAAPVIRLLARAVIGDRRVDSPLTVEVGTTMRFEAWGFTRPDSSDIQQFTDYTWQVPSRLGRATALGQLSVGTVAGVSDSIIFQRQGAQASFRLTTIPGAVSQIAITPADLTIAPGQRRRFTAQAFDRYNNRIPGQTFNWHVVGNIGTINRTTGWFTAGNAAGHGFVIAATIVNGTVVFGDNGATVTGTGRVVVRPALPAQFVLRQNMPNPFNSSTEIVFDLPVETPVCLTVYNLAGQIVERLVDQPYPAGTHRVRWEASNQPTGAYIYRLEAGVFREQRKMLLLR